jgi:hypothetical protein
MEACMKSEVWTGPSHRWRLGQTGAVGGLAVTGGQTMAEVLDETF